MAIDARQDLLGYALPLRGGFLVRLVKRAKVGQTGHFQNVDYFGGVSGGILHMGDDVVLDRAWLETCLSNQMKQFSKLTPHWYVLVRQ